MSNRAGAATAVLSALVSGPAAAATLSVEVDGIAPGAGAVRVAVCVGGLEAADCPTGQTVAAEAGALRVVFPNMPAGTYAVAAYQDLDGSGRLGRTRLGLPTQPFGLSNGAGRRARPSFEMAAFALAEPGATVRVRLQGGAQGRPVPGR